MNRYALLKFIASVDSVDSRKRLQKSLFFIQAAGYDLDADYDIHLYGPYSRDVAEATDLLTQNDYLAENVTENGCGGVQYCYTATEPAKENIEEYEKTVEGQEAKKKIDKHIPLFQRLNEENLWSLELASTIAFYKFSRQLSWEEAKLKTSIFKRVKLGHPIMEGAETFARNILDQAI